MLAVNPMGQSVAFSLRSSDMSVFFNILFIIYRHLICLGTEKADQFYCANMDLIV